MIRTLEEKSETFPLVVANVLELSQAPRFLALGALVRCRSLLVAQGPPFVPGQVPTTKTPCFSI